MSTESTYSITEQAGDKTVNRKVEATETAYDVIGIRQDGKYTLLDHIPSGCSIGRFKTYRRAIEAVRELIQVSDFKWKTPPPAIKDACKDILKRLSA